MRAQVATGVAETGRRPPRGMRVSSYRRRQRKRQHKKTERGAVAEILMRRLPFSAAAVKFIFQMFPEEQKWP